MKKKGKGILTVLQESLLCKLGTNTRLLGKVECWDRAIHVSNVPDDFLHWAFFLAYSQPCLKRKFSCHSKYWQPSVLVSVLPRGMDFLLVTLGGSDVCSEVDARAGSFKLLTPRLANS